MGPYLILSLVLLLDGSVYGDGTGFVGPIADRGHHDHPIAHCGALTADHWLREIRYPPDGGPYPNDDSVCWHIEAAYGLRIRMTVKQYDMEDDPECVFDGLVVIDSDRLWDRFARTQTYCGSRTNWGCDFITSGSHLFLRFYSDYSATGSGFRVTYTVARPHDRRTTCQRSMHGFKACPMSQTGQLALMNADRNMNCRWHFRSDKGKQIRLVLSLIDLPHRYNCRGDFLRIIDTDDMDYYICERLSAGSTCTFVSKGPDLILEFSTNYDRSEESFILSYDSQIAGHYVTSCGGTNGTAGPGHTPGGPGGKPTTPDGEGRPTTQSPPTSSVCGQTSYTAHNGTITSPNYPSTYPNNVNCVYSITAPADRKIAVKISEQSIEPAPDCRYDFLQINGLSSFDGSYMGCGVLFNQRYTSASNRLDISFHTDTSSGSKGFHLVYQTYSSNGPVPFAPANTDQQCGVSVLSRHGERVYGGAYAVPKEVPWQLALPANGQVDCGATIVSRHWALGAAHCFSDPNQKVIITAGDYNVLTNDGTEQTVAVRVTKHPQYDEATASNDIALLKFDTPLGFSDSVRPACIVTSHPPSSSTCYASGWGRTDGLNNTILNKVRLPLIDRNTCNQWLGGAITETTFCAGRENGGIDTCQGDSGGPLVCSVGGKWYLTGITSWGAGCGESRRPGVYTRVEKYIDWIKFATDGQLSP